MPEMHQVQHGMDGFIRSGDFRPPLAGEFFIGKDNDGNIWRADTNMNTPRRIVVRDLRHEVSTPDSQVPQQPEFVYEYDV